ncbi:transcription termination factor Rho [Mycobacterium avium subsp. paratuberculosis]|uniref:Transcription termination factor Rho n=9 Tax=Mycobacterium avium TaxID=1764 RepID=Q73X46_MYCPA|nr:transcription termination factor Rho [Mycobacterium avium]ELP47658.1 transcription termination factor Rho [Mycobacterium avium subsp. paratuberculosis S5]AAS04781.1 Rho [Mycobacterium avium subsp. paratuberculosis K-10]AGL36292.1 Transcription termination factor Rho [Mycobacterium avium subsp. paratuberculosis MAP4]ANH29133.1 transcription termination factor Rho [Mycobacterium avium subsp. paratuberculosis]ASE14717.1 transcription termination factor Rho [Mycobacterium avium subsp. paratuber
MTDTDLFTAGENTDANQLSTAVTTDTPDAKTHAPVGALTTMVLPELRALANQVGVKGTSGMRKNELIAAIKEVRGQANGAAPAEQANGAEPAEDSGKPDAKDAKDDTTPDTKDANDHTGAQSAAEAPAPSEQNGATAEAPRRERRSASRDAGAAGRGSDDADRETDGREQSKQDSREQSKQDGGDQDQQSSGGQQGRGSNQQDDDGEGRQGRRGRRFRDRRRRGERSGEGGDAELREDDVVQPVAGILDVLDNYAFVRTSGYLAGPHDVYVSMNMVRKNGLRRGDAVTGAVRVPKDGEQPNQRQKFNPLVRLDSVNGGSVEDAKKRPEFGKLTPLYPNQRLRLETTPDRLTTRVIDLIMPIGKGQRALIVSPPKAGKTTILQDIANAITKNNPECHLMVVLVDERPEEVTDMQRSVKGEVIASTFDRPPSDHTSVAELAIERAKRLVEQGKDVVVLLDSITRLGRAYNNASPASGRILSGGVDSTALYPPKRFLGAARNIEEGGSLTIIATAMVETGSTGDTVIFEEFKGTGNAELKLDRKIAERRVFPAVDVNPSGTRKDELLLSPDEFGIVHKLRRVLSGLDSHQAIDLLMSQLRKTKNNYEFLVQVSKTTPGAMDND